MSVGVSLTTKVKRKGPTLNREIEFYAGFTLLNVLIINLVR